MKTLIKALFALIVGDILIRIILAGATIIAVLRFFDWLSKVKF